MDHYEALLRVYARQFRSRMRDAEIATITEKINPMKEEDATMSTGEEIVSSEMGNGEQPRESENRVSRFKATASRALQDSRDVAQRWGRQSRAFANNATDRIKDDPVRSVIIGFVIGLSVGALIGRLSGRQCQSR